MQTRTLRTDIRKLNLAIALGVIAISQIAMATDDYYTWVDENGVTNYAAKQPPGYEAAHITKESKFGYSRVETAPARTPTASASNPTEAPATDGNDTADLDTQIAIEKARIDQEISQAKKSNCAIGKRNLVQLEAYARIKIKDDDGTERTLTDSEKASRIAQANQTIRENCRG